MTSRRWWVLAPVLGVAACGGATFKIVQTPWQGDESTARLARGATSAGCRVSEPDSTGEIEIRCPNGVPEPGRDEGSIRVGPDSEGVLLAMCNDGLAEGCGAVLEKFWKAGER
ncbi:MAG: hypothetical protein KF718_32360 [Polyangiaceae bacterium]|nr:hypothetical protein [Polyangiaceae bacterium]